MDLYEHTPRSPVLNVAWNLLLITVGSALCALAVNGLLIPYRFLSGGFTGLALVMHYLFPRLPDVATLYLLMNVPVYVLGWRMVGRRFLVYSLAGSVIFTMALQWVNFSFPALERIMAALLAGIITGLGSGLILRSLGSAGGIDILAVILVRRLSIRLGSTILAFNATILAAAALLFSLEGALYTLVFLFVSSHITNLVVTGLSQRKAVLIISPRWKEISQGVLSELRRGATMIPARGAFTGKSARMIYTVISFNELGRLKKLIRRLDPDAFVVVTDTMEVMGLDIGNQPHW
ncbi:hypothetical protein AAU61_04985 [Desulfocarbo indianensis]|nr:hypothetical protein AAU61_04985 [Desulfocarbo indianensis]